MATIETSNTNWSKSSTMRITYTAYAGCIAITGLEGKRNDNYESYLSSAKSLKINNTNCSLKSYIYFGKKTYKSFNPSSTFWLYGSGNTEITIQLPTGSVSWSGRWFKVTINIPSPYSISYAANGGTSTPSAQNKNYNQNITIANAIAHNNTSQNGYTVTFNANGGSVSPTTKTASDTVAWSFRSWKSSATGTTWSAGATNFSENNTTTLTAQWSTSISSRGSITTPSATKSNGTSTRTVTFNANNGSTTKSSQNSTATITYSSNGWYTAASGGTKRCANGGSYTPGSSETVYAQWSSSTGSYSSITFPTASQCTRTNYTLLGWSTSSSATSATWSPGATYTPDATKTVYAVWQINNASFNLNILNPDGSEPYTTGEAGTIEQSINGGSYTRIYNEQASSYPIGTTFNYRNFIGGTGRHLSSVSGITPNNTTGPWSATLGSEGLTVNFYTAWNSHTLTYYPYGGTYNGTTSNSTFTQNYGTTKNLGTPTPPTGHIFAGYHTNGSLTGISSSDSLFESGYGNIGVYNNSGNGIVTHIRVQNNDVPSVGYGSGSVGYEIFIGKATGTASPGCGGFYLSTVAKANHVYRCFIWAKIPTTHYIADYRNAIGDGGYSVWLTEQKGTGDWYKYVYEVHAGSSGNFSSFGHVALNAINGDNNAEVYWEVCATQITDISDNLTFTYDDANRYVECYHAPLKYTITYNANGGSGAPEDTIYTYASSGTTNLSSTIPTKDGYIFLGWSTDSAATTATYTAGQAWNLSNAEDYTLYAIWVPAITYTVAYNANGGTSTPASQTKIHDVDLILAAGISRNEVPVTGATVTFHPNGGHTTISSRVITNINTYRFYRWRATNGTDYLASGTYTANESTTMTARWDLASTRCGSVNLPDATECTRQGYLLLGFDTSPTATTPTYQPGDSVSSWNDIIYYAIWERLGPQIYKNINGTWYRGDVFIKINGTWISADEVYIKLPVGNSTYQLIYVDNSNNTGTETFATYAELESYMQSASIVFKEVQINEIRESVWTKVV